MNKIVSLLLVFVFAGCALSHSRRNDFGSDTDSNPLLAGSGGQLSFEREDTVSEGSVSEGDVGDPSNGTEAILFDVAPSVSCTNKDLWLNLFGHGIHWNATVEITYPHSGDTITIDEQSDDCGNSILEWVDSDQIVFRTHPSLGSMVSGFYLVSVVQPDGSSNAVGLNLQWCDEDVQEVPSCGQWSDEQ